MTTKLSGVTCTRCGFQVKHVVAEVPTSERDLRVADAERFKAHTENGCKGAPRPFLTEIDGDA